MSTFTRWVNKCDILTKTTVVSSTGQKTPTYAISSLKQKCIFAPRFSTIDKTRVGPTYEGREDLILQLPGDVSIDYTKQIENIRDRKGNIFEIGPFEIVQIIRQPGFYGQVHHIFVTIRRVIES